MTAILLDRRASVARLTLNRPDAGNAIDLPMARALLQAAIDCDRDPAIRCVAVAGTGAMFCVGGDIGGFLGAGDKADAYLSELAGTMTLALSRLARMAKPLVTLVDGPAAGAGLSLAIMGDVVLASPRAQFSSAYTAIGLVPDCGLTWWLPRVVGLRRAQEMIATNRRVGADEASAIGLVTRIVADLDREGTAVAATLAEGPVGAWAATRALLLDSFSATLETQSEREARAIAAAGVGAEGREGVAAFLAKRRPRFDPS